MVPEEASKTCTAAAVRFPAPQNQAIEHEILSLQVVMPQILSTTIISGGRAQSIGKFYISLMLYLLRSMHLQMRYSDSIATGKSYRCKSDSSQRPLAEPPLHSHQIQESQTIYT